MAKMTKAEIQKQMEVNNGRAINAKKVSVMKAAEKAVQSKRTANKKII